MHGPQKPWRRTIKPLSRKRQMAQLARRRPAAASHSGGSWQGELFLCAKPNLQSLGSTSRSSYYCLPVPKVSNPTSTLSFRRLPTRPSPPPSPSSSPTRSRPRPRPRPQIDLTTLRSPSDCTNIPPAVSSLIPQKHVSVSIVSAWF